MTEAAGPRMYQVRFNAPTARSGELFTALLKETKTPPELKSTNDPDRMQMSFITVLSGLGVIVSLLEEIAENLVVQPFIEKQSEALRPFQNKPQSVAIPAHVPITRLPEKRVHGMTGRVHPLRGKGAGAKAVAAVFEEIPLARASDFQAEFIKRGLSAGSVSGVLDNLKKYGLVVRQEHGLWRLPTEDERQAFNEAQAQEIKS